jgi:hypothetical protein
MNVQIANPIYDVVFKYLNPNVHDIKNNRYV